MPSVLASPSPIRRYGGSNYSNYTSSSAYSRSSTSYGGRTSSLDRSTYSSYVSSYKYASGSSGSSSKDYTSRPPIGSGALRNTTVAPSSIYSSSRVSPARSYLSRKSTSIEDGGGSSSTTSAGSSSSLRNRETQSESREGNNNTYTNGNVRRGVRDYSAYSPTSSSSTSTLSKYRTSAASSTATRSKYGDYSDTSKTEMPKINERVRSYQSSREPVFQSRFLRSRQENAAANQAASAVKSDDKSAVSEEAEEEPRPSVAELRRRYDQNRNDVGAAKETSAKSTARARSASESDSDDSSDRDTIRSSVSPAKPPPPPPLPPPVAAAKSSTARRVQNSPDRIATNGALDRKDATKSREPEDNKSIHQSSNDARRSSSPSTLSSSSDGESLDNVASPVAERRPTVTRSRAAATSATPGRVTASRNSISDSDSESLSKSPKLSANRKAKLAASAAATAAAAAAAAASSTSNSLERQGLVGFRNIGNTCFMNSVLQCLSNTRSVLEYVLNDEYVSHINTTISSMNGALIKAFATVMVELWKQEDDEYLSGAVNPTALKTQIQKFAPRFMGYNQQDSQEFLRYLLEGLHEDVNRVPVKPKPLEHDIDDNLSDAQKATESWKRYLRRDDSKIVDLFVGQLKSTLQCTVCGHCSVTFDPFWDLSLPIPPSARSVSSVKVQHCLDLFAKEEILDGDEKPTCAKCQARRKCTKTFSIQKFPQILVLHLKRFSPGERFRKLDASVDFPLTDLDLSAYSAAGLKPTPCSYRLYGVINHSGTAYSGHYTAFCRHPYSNTWHEYNDSRVTNISPQRIVSPEAYLLFYEMESQEARL